MNWDRMEGNWKQFSGKVKQQWGKLTDDQLTQINGRRDQLIGKIQEAYGIGQDEADRQVKDWEKLNGSDVLPNGICRSAPGKELVPGAGLEPAHLAAGDFHTTSAFAAPRQGLRGLEHAFTLAALAVGARRLLSTPSLLQEGLARH